MIIAFVHPKKRDIYTLVDVRKESVYFQRSLRFHASTRDKRSMNLRCEEILENPSPPSLFRIAAAEFINTRQVRWKYGGTFEEVCKFLIEGTPINFIRFEIDWPTVNRVLFSSNTLSEILASEERVRKVIDQDEWEQGLKPYRPYDGWLKCDQLDRRTRRAVRSGYPSQLIINIRNKRPDPYRIKVNLPEEFEESTPTKRYRRNQCCFITDNDWFCWEHHSVT